MSKQLNLLLPMPVLPEGDAMMSDYLEALKTIFPEAVDRDAFEGFNRFMADRIIEPILESPVERMESTFNDLLGHYGLARMGLYSIVRLAHVDLDRLFQLGGQVYDDVFQTIEDSEWTAEESTRLRKFIEVVQKYTIKTASLLRNRQEELENIFKQITPADADNLFATETGSMLAFSCVAVLLLTKRYHDSKKLDVLLTIGSKHSQYLLTWSDFILGKRGRTAPPPISAQEEERRMQQVQFARQRVTFLQKKQELLNDPAYRNKFVAVVDGKVVDSDYNDGALAERMYRKFGYIPLYIGKIATEEETFDVPSPELA
jgi:hypothetical protein